MDPLSSMHSWRMSPGRPQRTALTLMVLPLAPAISDPKKQGATKGPSSGGGSCTIEGIEGIAFDLSGTLWGSLSAQGGWFTGAQRH
jgi:hypothetical protein